MLITLPIWISRSQVENNMFIHIWPWHGGAILAPMHQRTNVRVHGNIWVNAYADQLSTMMVWSVKWKGGGSLCTLPTPKMHTQYIKCNRSQAHYVEWPMRRSKPKYKNCILLYVHGFLTKLHGRAHRSKVFGLWAFVFAQLTFRILDLQRKTTTTIKTYVSNDWVQVFRKARHKKTF